VPHYSKTSIDSSEYLHLEDEDATDNFKFFLYKKIQVEVDVQIFNLIGEKLCL